MNKGERLKVRGERLSVIGYRLSVIGMLALLVLACNPDAKWTTKDVSIDITPYTVSAGYMECSFATDKEAYYLVACKPANSDYDPTDPSLQKQFMTLELDSAYTEYIQWRSWLLQGGEFTIAPFASHSLQYGDIDHFFTNLIPNTDYWVYAFVVDPETLKPAGKLFLKTIRTTATSTVDVKFEYRVRGYWDYIYPINVKDGKINSHYPYLASTVDSLYLADEAHMTPEEYFTDLFLTYSKYNYTEVVRFGVQVVFNDGLSSSELFQEGHTYYTAIVSFDGFMGRNVIYRFTWLGEEFEAYFKDEDSIVSYGEDE